MPLAYCTIAPGEGQAFRQPGSCAVHAAVLADQPLQIALGVLHFREAHQGPGALVQIVRILVLPDVGADLIAQIVPFHAGDLARLAADAFGRVDELGDFASAARHRGCRAPAVVVAERRTMSSDCSAIFSYSFSTRTRNDLDSGVCELASPTKGVSVLAMKPGLARPLKAQWIGIPT